MPETVDDFMRRFGGEGTVDDREASRFHERFVSRNPEDNDFDNQTYQQGATEYLGKLPDDEFQRMAKSAVSQTPPQERSGLLGSLLSALGGTGLAQQLGLGSSDPNQMSEEDASRVLDYARKEKPEALRKTVEEKPWFIKAMGNPVVLGALTMRCGQDDQKSTPKPLMSILNTLLANIFGQPNPGATVGSASVSPSPAPTAPETAPAPKVDLDSVLDARAAKHSEGGLDWKHSVVDLMKLVGMDSSLAARRELAAELHYPGDPSDSAELNIWLHRAVLNKIAENGGQVPAEFLH